MLTCKKRRQGATDASVELRYIHFNSNTCLAYKNLVLTQRHSHTHCNIFRYAKFLPASREDLTAMQSNQCLRSEEVFDHSLLNTVPLHARMRKKLPSSAATETQACAWMPFASRWSRRGYGYDGCYDVVCAVADRCRNRIRASGFSEAMVRRSRRKRRDLGNPREDFGLCLCQCSARGTASGGTQHTQFAPKDRTVSLKLWLAGRVVKGETWEILAKILACAWVKRSARIPRHAENSVHSSRPKTGESVACNLHSVAVPALNAKDMETWEDLPRSCTLRTLFGLKRYICSLQLPKTSNLPAWSLPCDASEGDDRYCWERHERVCCKRCMYSAVACGTGIATLRIQMYLPRPLVARWYAQRLSSDAFRSTGTTHDTRRDAQSSDLTPDRQTTSGSRSLQTTTETQSGEVDCIIPERATILAIRNASLVLRYIPPSVSGLEFCLSEKLQHFGKTRTTRTQCYSTDIPHLFFLTSAIKHNMQSLPAFLPPLPVALSHTRTLSLSQKPIATPRRTKWRMTSNPTEETGIDTTPTPVAPDYELDTEAIKEKAMSAISDVGARPLYYGKIAGYAVGALVTVTILRAVISAVDSIPVLPGGLELVGLGYTAWFVWRYVLFKESRQELLDEIEEFLGRARPSK